MSKKLVEERTKEMDKAMETCEHPVDKRISLSAGGKNEVCGLCGKVFA